MNPSIRCLNTFSRQTNIYIKYNKSALRMFACNAKIANNVYQVPLFKPKRNYADLATNIIKSPVPDTYVPEVLLTDFIWSKAEKWSDLTVTVCGMTGREMTYKQLRLLSRRLAASLLKKGFKGGDVIALILPNMPEFPVVSLGILEAGLAITTINPLYTIDEMAHQILSTKAVAVVTIPEKLDEVMEAISSMEGKHKDYALKLRLICTYDIFGSEPDLPCGVERYSDLIGDDVDVSILSSLQSQTRTAHDVAFIPYSSGTTGKPKGVCLTHKNLIASIIAVNVRDDLKDVINGRQEIVPFILPGFHIFGFSICLLHGIFSGAKMITLPKFNEYLFLKVLEENKCTVLFAVPPIVLYIGSSPSVTEEHLKSVELIMTGAAPMAETDIMECVKKSPPTLSYAQGYGLTETSAIVCSMNRGLKKYDSVGALSVNTFAKIADLQTNEALGPFKEGEICIKGPQVMKGYLNNETATAEVFDSEGWFHTGDIGYYDNEEYFYITDRLKELIKVKGFQVAPAELEGLLRTHPEVEDAGVIGIPDPRKGETPIGFVQLKKGAKITKEELKAFLNPKVAKYKQIETIIFVESIPKSITGKILRKDLKENYLRK